MRHAVARINPDPEGALPLELVLRVREALRAGGTRVVDTDLSRSLPRRREIELVLADDDPGHVQARALALVRQAMRAVSAPGEPAAGPVTFTSAGTPADALGILRAFGVAGEIGQAPGADPDAAVFIVPEDAFEHVSESRLRTALQSALNQEVTLVTEWSGPWEPLVPAPGG